MTSTTQPHDLAILAPLFRQAAILAGRAIMEIYEQTSMNIHLKTDGSPVTMADHRADEIIRDLLHANLPNLCQVSEERLEDVPLHLPDEFVLIDPLDGTKEFINRRDEFTVNLGFVKEGKPLVGCVFVPAWRELFLTTSDGKATREILPPDWRASDDVILSGMTQAQIITCRDDHQIAETGLIAVGSRSHRDPQTHKLLTQLHAQHIKSYGSSLKFCMIAAGQADIYPRFAPTMQWDTAAAHAIVNAAGGFVSHVDGQGELRYGGPSWRNPYFVASSACVAWQEAM